MASELTIRGTQENPAPGHTMSRPAEHAELWGSASAVLLSIVNNAPDLIVVLDVNLQVRLFNQKAANFVQLCLGLKLNVGMRASEFFLAHFASAANAMLAAALSGFQHESQLTTAAILSGQPKHLKLVAQPLQLSEGSIAGVMLTAQDVTENMELQKVAARYRRELQLLLGNLSEPFVVIDRQLNIVLFNEVAAKGVQMLGGKALEVGRNIFEFGMDPSDVGTTKSYIDAAMRGEHMERSFEFELPSGPLMLNVQYRPAYDDLGNIAGCIINAANVTETKAANHRLEDNERRWRFALEGSNQGVWDWDIAADTVFYSDSWYRMMGYSGSEIGSTDADWEAKLHPDDLATMRRHKEQHLNSETAAYESEFRMLDRDGHYRWILSQGMIMERAPDGKPTRMIGTHTDITSRKLVEEKYKSIFYKNPLPMWTFDRETLQFLDVNQAAVEQYGYTTEEFLRMKLSDIRPEEDRERLTTMLNRNNDSLQHNGESWRHKKKNGELIWVRISGFTFQEHGRSISLVTAEDITRKTLDEERLKASETMYRQLFRNIPLPAFVYDTETLNIREVNDTAATHYGYSTQEFSTLKLTHLVPEEDHTKLLEQIERHKISTQSVSIVHGKHLTSDGRIRLVEVWSSAMDMPGSTLRLVIVNDITEKTLAEEALKASSERFRYVMNATNDIVWDWKIGANSILWSNHYEDVLGWKLPPDNHLPIRQAFAAFHPDDRERVRESLEQAIKQSDGLWENAFRYRRSDGQYAYVLAKGLILRRQSGEAVRMIGALHDITEQQYQQEVQELEIRVFSLSSKPEAKLPMVLENIARGLEQLHGHMRAFVVRFEDNGKAFVVSKLKTLVMMDWVKNFALEHRNEWMNSALRKHLATYNLESADRKLLMAECPGFEATQLLSLPAFNTDGSLLASLVVLVVDGNGLSNAELSTLYRMQNLIRILVAQHASVEQIRLAHERYDNVLKATHDLIWDWDIVSGSFYRSQEASKKREGVHQGRRITSVHHWLERIHPEDHGKVQQVIESVLQNNLDDTFEVEYRFLNEDGSYEYLYDRGIIIRNEEGKPVRMIGAAQNISDRKRLEHELLQQELERQRVISQATIDTQEQERAEIGKELHDNVNQILTTTKLYLDLAQSNHDLKDELLAKSSRNVIHVINEIRQLSRSLMDPSIGDLGLVASIRDLMENINLTRRINISLSADEQLDALLDASRQLTVFRITQEAMSNIIRHAQATEVKITLKKSGQSVMLQVTDNGIGFDPDAVKSGIGLKNIRNRVYLVHGSLQIKSALGKGTTLNIKFPIHKSPE